MSAMERSPGTVNGPCSLSGTGDLSRRNTDRRFGDGLSSVQTGILERVEVTFGKSRTGLGCPTSG